MSAYLFESELFSKDSRDITVAELEVAADAWESEGDLVRAETLRQHAEIYACNQAAKLLKNSDPNDTMWEAVETIRHLPRPGTRKGSSMGAVIDTFKRLNVDCLPIESKNVRNL